MSHPIENLESVQWETPNHYFGFSPTGDFCIYSRCRDSSILDDSNFYCILSELTGKAMEYDKPEPFDASDYGSWDSERIYGWVYTWTAGCSMFGHFEYIMLRHDAPEELLKVAGEIIGALDNYPVMDEMDYSDRQVAKMGGRWATMSLPDRVVLCRENGDSIFSARRDEIPEGVFDDFRDSEEFV